VWKFSNLIPVRRTGLFPNPLTDSRSLLSAICRAYAKINLGLHVLARRPDGFHELSTIFHRIDVSDEIRFESDASVRVLSNSPEAPGDETNLCFRAAHAVQRLAAAPHGVALHLTKNIPVGAGLGGGSSDAAAVLKFLPLFWNVSVDPRHLAAAAAELGSDVPYFLGEGSALAGGRGEILDYVTFDLPYTILVCFPGIHVSTAWAYGRVSPDPSRRGALRNVAEKGFRDLMSIRDLLTNDFETPVFREFPAIARVKDTMIRAGALFSSLSGSGSAVYGLYNSERRAAAAAVELQASGYSTWLTAPNFHPPS
jgi:4-diphosphocytidyl-2-C-methyl-D-erythritol kinase